MHSSRTIVQEDGSKNEYDFVDAKIDANCDPTIISPRSFSQSDRSKSLSDVNNATHLSRVDLLAGERVVVGTHLECWRCVTGRFVVWRIEVVVEKSRREPLFRGGGSTRFPMISIVVRANSLNPSRDGGCPFYK